MNTKKGDDCQACGGTGEQEAEGPIEDGRRLETCKECGG